MIGMEGSSFVLAKNSSLTGMFGGCSTSEWDLVSWICGRVFWASPFMGEMQQDGVEPEGTVMGAPVTEPSVVLSENSRSKSGGISHHFDDPGDSL
jgi:hypothetical protein